MRQQNKQKIAVARAPQAIHPELVSFLQKVRKELQKKKYEMPGTELKACGDCQQDILPDLYCPMCLEIPKDAVLCEGYIYSGTLLSEWLAAKGTSPMTRAKVKIVELGDSRKLLHLFVEQMCHLFNKLKSTPDMTVSDAKKQLIKIVDHYELNGTTAAESMFQINTSVLGTQANAAQQEAKVHPGNQSSFSREPPQPLSFSDPFSSIFHARPQLNTNGLFSRGAQAHNPFSLMNATPLRRNEDGLEINNVMRLERHFLDRQIQPQGALIYQANEELKKILDKLKSTVFAELQVKWTESTHNPPLHLLIKLLINIIPRVIITQVDCERYTRFSGLSHRALSAWAKAQASRYYSLSSTISKDDDVVSYTYKMLLTYFLSPEEASEALMTPMSKIMDLSSEKQLLVLDRTLQLEDAKNDSPFFGWLYSQNAISALDKLTPGLKPGRVDRFTLVKHASQYFNVHLMLQSVTNIWLLECLEACDPLQRGLIMDMMYDADIKDIGKWIHFARQNGMHVLVKMCSIKILRCCATYNEVCNLVPDDYILTYNFVAEEMQNLLMVNNLFPSEDGTPKIFSSMSELREATAKYHRDQHAAAMKYAGNSFATKILNNRHAIDMNGIESCLPMRRINRPVYRSLGGKCALPTPRLRLPERLEEQQELTPHPVSFEEIPQALRAANARVCAWLETKRGGIQKQAAPEAKATVSATTSGCLM